MTFVQYRIQIPKKHGYNFATKYMKKINYKSMKITKNFYEYKLADKKGEKAGTLIFHDSGIRVSEYII